MREPEIALVFSPEAWVEDLHRSCTDHGGARVRHLVLDPGLARADDYDTLVVSHRWPGLSRALVSELHEQGRRVLGVCDAAEPEARRHLESLGVDAVVDGESGPDEIVGAVVALGVAHASGRSRRVEAAEPAGERGPVVVVGGPPGGGTTELAVALAHLGVGRTGDWVLVDGDDVAPSIAVRLGLAPEPGLTAAVEALEHGGGDLGLILQRVPSGPWVLAGLAHGGAWAQVRAAEVVRVVRTLARGRAGVVVDTGAPLDDVRTRGRGRYSLARALVGEADALVAVTDARPVGIARLVEWIAAARPLAPETPLHVVLNRSPKDAYRRRQLLGEVAALGVARSVHAVPEDRRVAPAAWDGGAVARGPFRRAVTALAHTLARPAVAA